MAAVPRPLVRRTISVPSIVLAMILGVILTPLALVLTGLVDVVFDRDTRFRRTRIWLLVTAALTLEFRGLVRAAALAIRHRRAPRSPRAVQANFELELWWVGRHNRNLRRFAGLRWFVENPELIHKGNAIVIARHRSHADALLPVLLFGHGGGLELRYTLKDDLQWAPAMDVVGNRTPNVFVDRTPGPDSPLLARMQDLAAGVDERSVTVIFPEGTFYTPERRDRAASRIAETRPDLEAAARRLRFILPPRPAGTLALLRGAPEADVVFVGHEGLDRFGSLREIFRNIPLQGPVRVRLWRIERALLPDDEDEVIGWLLDRWLEIDDWIAVRSAERARGMVTAEALSSLEEITT